MKNDEKPTCATCSNGRPLYGGGIMCGDESEANPMKWWKVPKTFGCIFHTPLSPDPPQPKYHAVTPPMMPAPYQPPRDISDQVFPKPEEKS